MINLPIAFLCIKIDFPMMISDAEFMPDHFHCGGADPGALSWENSHGISVGLSCGAVT